jgi:hypothetical protein
MLLRMASISVRETYFRSRLAVRFMGIASTRVAVPAHSGLCNAAMRKNERMAGIAEVHLPAAVLEDEGRFGNSKPIVRTYPSIHELQPRRLTRVRSLRFFRFDLLCELVSFTVELSS